MYDKDIVMLQVRDGKGKVGKEKRERGGQGERRGREEIKGALDEGGGIK